MSKNFKRYTINTLSIILGIFYSFPILYMFLTGFKREDQVTPPSFVFTPTLENFNTIINDALFLHLANSVLITIGTVLLSVLLAVPASYAIVYGNMKKAEDVYYWFITTTLLPAVGVIVPVFLAINAVGLTDTHASMILLYTGAGVPLMVWMTTTFFRDVPISLVEAADIDGATRVRSFFSIMLPLVRGGIVSAALLTFITTWNEFFFAASMTYTRAPTLPVYMNRYLTKQGLFWASMCAVSSIVVIVPVILGFFAQKALVQGLTVGAVKE